MALYPNVQKRAHDELVSVIGAGTLPDMSSRSTLPFLVAVIKETMRWQPLNPLGERLWYRSFARWHP